MLLRYPRSHELTSQGKPLGFFATGKQIVARETPLGLYKGLGAVVTGIVPKMAIRFASFEREYTHNARASCADFISQSTSTGLRTLTESSLLPTFSLLVSAPVLLRLSWS